MKACFRWAQIQKRLSSPGKSTVSKQTAAFRMGCGLVRQFSKKPTRATAWRRCSVLLIGSGQTNTLWNTVSVRMTAIQKAGAAAGRHPHSAEGWLLTEQHRPHGSLSSWRVSERNGIRAWHSQRHLCLCCGRGHRAQCRRWP